MNAAGPKDGTMLPTLARRALEQHFQIRPQEPEPLPPWLREPAATFVTLRTRDGDLRGCIGSLEAKRPLIEDLTENAIAAATRDPRFPPVAPNELADLHIEVSRLTPPTPLEPGSEADILQQLRPGIDGVVLSWRTHRSTFLPQVWDQLHTPERFLAELKKKAHLSPDFWAPDVQIAVYQAEKWLEVD